MLAPFPYFGGKRDVAADVWRAFGSPKQYIEPFCGSCAVLLAAPRPASLEVVCDTNGFVANFWRAVKNQPGEVAHEADIDLGTRYVWLMEQRERIASELQDCEWPGDAKAAGYWLWGQCCWIGSGWAEWDKAAGQVPHASDAGKGIQAAGQVPAHHIGGVCSPVRRPDNGEGMWTSSGRVAWTWLRKLAARLERVRVVHGNWDRCLNNHYGGKDTAVFLDPPYRDYEGLYGTHGVADVVAQWALEHAELRVVLCGHVGDYDLPGWVEWPWKRKRLTYSGDGTTDKEHIWFSPVCYRIDQPDLFSRLGVAP